MWQKIWRSKYVWGSVAVWLIAIAVRAYGVTTPAQYYDMGTFQAWAQHMAAVGPVHFFSSIWTDYVPLPLYTLAPIQWIAVWLHAPFAVTFKSVTSLVELALLGVMWGLGGKKIRWGVVLLLLSPALVGDTAFWGQLDTIPALLALLSLILLLKKPSSTIYHPRSTIYAAAILYGLAVAYKPIMILMAPVLWIVCLQKKDWWRLPVISAAVAVATGIPAIWGSAPWWHTPLDSFTFLYERAIIQASTYPFTTINAFNLWSILPHPSAWLPDDRVILGLTAHTFGLALFTIFGLWILNNWRKSGWKPQYAARVIGTIFVVFYTFTTRMHERHLLFGLPFLGLAAAFEPWLLIPFLLVTVGFTVNLYGAYFWVNHADVWPFGIWVISLVSWMNVVVAAALALVWNWSGAAKKLLAKMRDNKMLVGILVLAAFLRLYNLSYPPTYIFDEVYHAFTAKEFIANNKAAWEWWTTPPPGVAYEWTHPPVAKYGMVAGMLAFGEESFGWRIGSAIAGIIVVAGIYVFMSELTKNKRTALLSALLVSVEGLNISQSRVGMNDIYMLVFMVWSLVTALRGQWKRTAVLWGLSLASKWSAIYGLVPLALVYLTLNHPRLELKYWVRTIFFGIRLLAIGALVYILSYTPFIVAGHTYNQWWELQRQMWYYHTNLKATHAYQSVPLQWMFDIRPVWYYVHYGATGNSNIYAQGNPFLLWLGLGALVLSLKKILRGPYTLLYVLYAVFTLPWFFSPRIMFFYHYLPSATFLCCLVAVWLDTLPKSWRWTLIGLVFASLVFVCPIYFGFTMPHSYWDTMFTLMPTWK